MPQDRPLVILEMEGVRHHDPVERIEIECAGEIGSVVVDASAGKLPSHRFLVGPQSPGVPVDCVDLSAGAEEVGERERECAAARAEVGPCTARKDSIPEKPNVVRMVHDRPLDWPPHARLNFQYRVQDRVQARAPVHHTARTA